VVPRSVTAAVSTDGAAQPPTTAAQAATPALVLALVARLRLLLLLLLLRPSLSPKMESVAAKVELLALVRHSVLAARSTDGAVLPLDTVEADVIAARVVATKWMAMWR
jgi:hypothetical protein